MRYRMQESQAGLPLGSIIQEQYVIESVLDKANSGTVYLVRERQKQQFLFVLKEVVYREKEEQYGLNFESIERLEHPALPFVYHVFNDDKRDRVYILMDYIEGSNLEVL